MRFSWPGYIRTLGSILIGVMYVASYASARQQLNIALNQAQTDPLLELTPAPEGSGDKTICTLDGLLIRQGFHSQAQRPTGNIGVKAMLPASGDFEATLDFKVKQLEEPSEGWGQGLLFAVFLDDEKQTVLQLGLLSAPGKGIRIRAEVLGRFVDTHQKKYFDIEFHEGQFILGRTDNEAYFKVVSDGAQQELMRVDCPASDVRFVSTYCTRLPKGSTKAEYVLKNLHIAADQFYSYKAADHPAVSLWMILVVLQVVAIVSLLLKRGAIRT